MPRVPTPLAAFAAAASLALVIAACTPAGGAPDGGAAAQPTPADAAADWRTAPLTVVRTGETFAIADLAGKLVAIEPMATWCSNCLIQQKEAAVALAAVASDDLVYLGLDVDPKSPPGDLAAFAEREGFDWPYAVGTVDVLRSLAAEFGDQVLSPPSTRSSWWGLTARSSSSTSGSAEPPSWRRSSASTFPERELACRESSVAWPTSTGCCPAYQ